MLTLGPLASPRSPQHVQVHQYDRQVISAWFELLGYDPIDHHQPRARSQRAMAILQDSHAAFIVPVVDNALQHDRVGAGRDSVEEATSDEFASICDSGVREIFPCTFRTMRQIEDYAAHRWIFVEDRYQQLAESAADIHQRRNPGEVVCGEEAGTPI